MEIKQLSLQVAPNPNDGRFRLNLEIEEAKKYNIKIFNMLGQLVYSKERFMNCGYHSINMNLKVSSGLYFAYIERDDKYAVQKFVVLK